MISVIELKIEGRGRVGKHTRLLGRVAGWSRLRAGPNTRRAENGVGSQSVRENRQKNCSVEYRAADPERKSERSRRWRYVEVVGVVVVGVCSNRGRSRQSAKKNWMQVWFGGSCADAALHSDAPGN